MKGGWHGPASSNYRCAAIPGESPLIDERGGLPRFADGFGSCSSATSPVCSTLNHQYQDADGDTHYVYDWNGTTIESIIPSPSFNAMTATSSRLAKFNWPPRPASSSPQYSDWSADYGSIGFRPMPQPFCMRPGTKAILNNPNQAGYFARASGSGSYD